jgi:hypothetical protein
MRVLITGSRGYIGRVVLRSIDRDQIRVDEVDLRLGSDMGEIEGRSYGLRIYSPARPAKRLTARYSLDKLPCVLIWCKRV